MKVGTKVVFLRPGSEATKTYWEGIVTHITPHSITVREKNGKLRVVEPSCRWLYAVIKKEKETHD